MKRGAKTLGLSATLAALAAAVDIAAPACVPGITYADESGDTGGSGNRGNAGEGGGGAAGLGGFDSAGTAGTDNTAEPPGSHCEDDRDCISLRCDDGTCGYSEFSDPCREDSHCAGGYCDGSACGWAVAGAECDSGDECLSFICDGVCGQGEVGADCHLPTDCVLAHCDDGRCGLALAGTDCESAADCLSGICDEVCEPGPLGAECRGDEDCISLNCEEAICGRGRVGAGCSSGDECLSSDCYDASCLLGVAEADCRDDPDCMSRSCVDGSCEAPALVVQTERTENVDDPYLDLIFRVRNSGPPVTLSDLVVFYFYSPEAVVAQVLHATVSSGMLGDGEVLPRTPEPIAIGVYMVRIEFFSDVVLETDADTGTIHLQLRKQDGSDYDQSNDYSWPAESDLPDFGADMRSNPRTLLCQRIDDVWQPVWGNPYPTEPPLDPCGQL